MEALIALGMVVLMLAVALISIFGICAVAAIIKGFVISKLWVWFVVPVFSVPAISIVQAIGIGMVISLFTQDTRVAISTLQNSKADAKEKMKKNLQGIASIFIAPFITLFIAWIVKMFL